MYEAFKLKSLIRCTTRSAVLSSINIDNEQILALYLVFSKEENASYCYYRYIYLVLPSFSALNALIRRPSVSNRSLIVAGQTTSSLTYQDEKKRGPFLKRVAANGL